ncbi:MAG: sigma-70 family RNA polymerase sigma factor, partial [Chitinophagaceae bacterium]|nr:sigma-70 family RNA polymerase sigma factor [Chitinophagaceae bacterium]
AFNAMYHQYVSPLFVMAYKHVPNRNDAEDIVQEVFIDFWEKRKEIIIRSSLFNYLYSATRYRVLRFIKTHNTRPESLELFEGILEKYSLPEEHSDAAIRHIDQSVVTAIADLPEQMKKVWLLNTEAGMSVSAIAEHLQLAPQTVRNHLAKVRKRLYAIVSRLASFLFSISFWSVLSEQLLPCMLPNH